MSHLSICLHTKIHFLSRENRQNDFIFNNFIAIWALENSSKQGQKHHKSMSSKIFQKISKYFADFQFVDTRSLSPQSPTLTAFNFPLIVSFPQPDFATDFQNSIELHWLRLKTPLSRYYPEIPHQTGHVSSPSAILFTKKSRNFLDPKKH